jgi:hypothetical protein
VHGRETVASEIPDRQLGERGVAVQGAGGRDPFVEEREGGLLAFVAREAEDAVDSQPQDEVNAALSGGRDLGAVESLVHRAAGEALAALEGVDEGLSALGHRPGVELKTAQPAGAGGNHPRREQLEQPPDVGRRNEMQRTAQRPCADDGSVGDRAFDVRGGGVLHAQADGPQGAAVVLGLHGGEPGDDVERTRTVSRGNALIDQPAGGDLAGKHPANSTGVLTNDAGC